jgi:YkoY family integral membrane protein
MFGQTFAPGDLATIALLVALEGLLSIDNALVLGVLAIRLKPRLRAKALSYGLIGAFALRLAAVAAAAVLLRFSILKLIGALYLLWVGGRYFFPKSKPSKQHVSVEPALSDALWRTVVAIEFTDLAFAVDSILAAVALVGPAPAGSTAAIHPKLWVIVTGGMLGIVLMRFAAAGFSRLVERFPPLNRSAYLLVLLIAAKLFIDWAGNDSEHPNRIDFANPRRPEMWVFWACAVLCLAVGVLRKKGSKRFEN